MTFPKEVISCRIPLSFSFTASPIIWCGSHFSFTTAFPLRDGKMSPKAPLSSSPPTTAAIWIRCWWQWQRPIRSTSSPKNRCSKTPSSAALSGSWAHSPQRMPSTPTTTCSQRPPSGWTDGATSPSFRRAPATLTARWAEAKAASAFWRHAAENRLSPSG